MTHLSVWSFRVGLSSSESNTRLLYYLFFNLKSLFKKKKIFFLFFFLSFFLFFFPSFFFCCSLLLHSSCLVLLFPAASPPLLALPASFEKAPIQPRLFSSRATPGLNAKARAQIEHLAFIILLYFSYFFNYNKKINSLKNKILLFTRAPQNSRCS